MNKKRCEGINHAELEKSIRKGIESRLMDKDVKSLMKVLGKRAGKWLIDAFKVVKCSKTPPG